MTEAANTSTTSRADAPGELALVQAFINTREDDRDIEDFATPEGVRDWLSEQGWLGAGERLTEADRHQAVEVREALRSLCLANNGGPLDTEAVEALNHAGKSAEILVRFDQHGHGELAPARSGIDGALGRLLAIVFRSMAEDTWHRLKACPDDECLWAFYDHSKNRSRTWCSMEVCGNRSKARAYRARHAGKK